MKDVLELIGGFLGGFATCLFALHFPFKAKAEALVAEARAIGGEVRKHL